MTVKRNGDRVLLKNGKVSCSCCGGPPGGCCMYPAQALADGLYTADDLPDAVDFTYSASGNTFGPYTLTRTGTTFIGGPENEVKIELAGDIWVSGDGGGGIESFSCLINETFQPSGGGGYEITVEDQFADTYTASGVPVPPYPAVQSVTLTRISLCVWQGFDSCGGPVLLSYDGIAEGSGGPFGTYHWFITWQEYPFFNLFGCDSTPEGYGAEKTDPQSSPAGTYLGNSTITVS